MIRVLILLGLTVLLSIGLVTYALTDWNAAAWSSGPPATTSTSTSG